MLETMSLWTRKMTKLTRLAQVFRDRALRSISHVSLHDYWIFTQFADSLHASQPTMWRRWLCKHDTNPFHRKWFKSTPQASRNCKSVCVCERERERERVREREVVWDAKYTSKNANHKAKISSEQNKCHTYWCALCDKHIRLYRYVEHLCVQSPFQFPRVLGHFD